jgi:uncharacterized protein (TIGR02466 family)
MGELKEVNLFKDSLFESTIEYDNKLLLKEIDTIDKSTLEIVSNCGGWQSKSYYIGINPIIDDLFNNKIIKYLPEALNIYKVNKNSKDISLNYWININGKYNYNKIHDHNDSILSGVYYVKVPSNSGDIIFYKDSLDRLIERTEYNAYNCATYRYKIQENKMILFSPYLKHEVTQNLTKDEDDKRVSIAFNLYLT